MERRTLFVMMLIISVLGLLVASYQTYEHYFVDEAICDLSATFSCSLVTGSRFGEFPAHSGIATAAWGVLWWLAVLLLTRKSMRSDEDWEFRTFVVVLGGLGFVAYLLYVELYLLPLETGSLALCPFCTVQHVLIVLLVVLSAFTLRRPVREYLADLR